MADTATTMAGTLQEMSVWPKRRRNPCTSELLKRHNVSPAGCSGAAGIDGADIDVEDLVGAGDGMSLAWAGNLMVVKLLLTAAANGALCLARTCRG